MARSRSTKTPPDAGQELEALVQELGLSDDQLMAHARRLAAKHQGQLDEVGGEASPSPMRTKATRRASTPPPVVKSQRESRPPPVAVSPELPATPEPEALPPPVVRAKRPTHPPISMPARRAVARATQPPSPAPRPVHLPEAIVPEAMEAPALIADTPPPAPPLHLDEAADEFAPVATVLAADQLQTIMPAEELDGELAPGAAMLEPMLDEDEAVELDPDDATELAATPLPLRLPEGEAEPWDPPAQPEPEPPPADPPPGPRRSVLNRLFKKS
jgi:hypothetical protein